MGRRKALPPDFDGNYTEDMLSERQRNILKFVRTFINHKGYPPAVREIGAAVGLSSSASVHNHLKKLQEYGFIQRDAAKPRALELMSESDAWDDDVFMLSVCGDSMINAGILDHDYIIARKQNFANNGDIVVALIDGEETTVKRYFRELRSVRLQPENDKYEPIVGSDNIKVLGKVISVFRML